MTIFNEISYLHQKPVVITTIIIFFQPINVTVLINTIIIITLKNIIFLDIYVLSQETYSLPGFKHALPRTERHIYYFHFHSQENMKLACWTG